VNAMLLGTAVASDAGIASRPLLLVLVIAALLWRGYERDRDY